MRPEARTNLRALAVSLAQHPGSELLILGHTDDLGSGAYNQELSERRASSAASYLISQGVSGTRIATRGLGETEAIATNTTEAGRQANRRVERPREEGRPYTRVITMLRGVRRAARVRIVHGIAAVDGTHQL